MTPEQQHTYSLITESWGSKCAENYKKLVESKDYHLRRTGRLPVSRYATQESEERIKALRIKEKARMRSFGDYGNKRPDYCK